MNDAMDHAKTHVTKVNQVTIGMKNVDCHLHAVTLHIRTVDVRSRLSRDRLLYGYC